MSDETTLALDVPGIAQRPAHPEAGVFARLRLRFRRRPDHGLRDWELHDRRPASRLPDDRAEVAFVRGLRGY